MLDWKVADLLGLKCYDQLHKVHLQSLAMHPKALYWSNIFIKDLEDNTQCTLNGLLSPAKLGRVSDASGSCTVFQRTWTGWRIWPKKTSCNLRMGSAKSGTWGGITPGTNRLAPDNWKAALSGRIWASWWTSWKWISNVPLWLRKSTASWAAPGRVSAECQAR